MIGGVTLFVISGVSASGKSTVARLLAERFARGVCVPGDTIREMMVRGRADMRPGPGDEALRQLALRYAGALSVAGVFLGDGFDVVVEDVIIGRIRSSHPGACRAPSAQIRDTWLGGFSELGYGWRGLGRIVGPESSRANCAEQT